MTRLARRLALMAVLEPSYGAGAPNDPEWTWANALQILPRNRPRHRIERMNERRELYTPFLGASDEIPGPRVQEIEFEVELGPSGTPGVAPPWGTLLRACQFAQVVTPSNRVEYTPVSEPGESLTIRYWEDGHTYVSRGARGTVQFFFDAYKIPYARFRFRGYDTGSAVANWNGPANPYAAWKTPLMPHDATASRVRLGCTYNAGAISGGTFHPAKGFNLDMGDELTYDAIIGGEKVVVTAREPKGEMTLELTAAQEQQWRTDMNNSVETTFGWTLGNTNGNRISVFARRLQRQEAQGIDDNGFRRVTCNFGLILDKDDPDDDFMRIIVS
jgi:hypothetical protein